jgi:isocitrate dehydrogenase
MLKFIGWNEAAELIISALIETIGEGMVTYDLARQMSGSTEVKCSEFGELIRNKIQR